MKIVDMIRTTPLANQGGMNWRQEHYQMAQAKVRDAIEVSFNPTCRSFPPVGNETWFSEGMCDHPMVELRWRLVGNGIRWGYQCLKCGSHMVRMVRGADLPNAAKARASEYDPWLSKRWFDARREGLSVSEELQRLWRERYDRHLASEEWSALRLAAIERAGGKCEKCGSTSILQAHHLTYERLGEELDSDLMVLCKACHETVHGFAL